MSEQIKANSEWADKAKDTFSAERKEDIFVLVISAITVVLVMAGIIGPGFFKSLFF